MPQYFTPRGFAMYADVPTTEGNFSVQESSAAMIGDATGPWVWVGLNDERAHLTVEQATVVRDALTEFIDSASPDSGEVDR